MERILICTATYNEVDNIEELIEKIFQYLPEQEVLVIDDASPDGTGILLDKLAAQNNSIHVIQRPEKLGLGTAHKLAMKYAVHSGFDILITMDADFSHHPKYLTTFVELLSENDFVIGSRYIAGGGLGYSFMRTFISRTANILARYLLGIPLKECTTSYRGFQASLLKRLNVDAIHSDGYSFFVESIFYVSLLTRKISEFPIYFEDRRAGTSKISKIEIFKSILNLMRLFYMRLFPNLSKIQTKETPSMFHTACINCGKLFLSTSHNSIDKESSEYSSQLDRNRFQEKTFKCLNCGLIYTWGKSN
jgi:dolichol-phosphate mannosyltransferase